MANPDTLRSEVVRLHLAGNTLTMISRALGISRGQAGRSLNEWREGQGITARTIPFSQAEDTYIVRMYRRGMSKPSICKEMGRDLIEVERRLSQLGVSDRIKPHETESEVKPEQPVVIAQRERDRLFVKAIAEAMIRKEHLPGAFA
jgi:hypothetical protein